MIVGLRVNVIVSITFERFSALTCEVLANALYKSPETHAYIGNIVACTPVMIEIIELMVLVIYSLL